jgi:hypothetical protein
MAATLFPAPVTAVSDVANVVTATTANVLYESTGINLKAGTYTVTSPTTVVVNVEFFNETTSLVTATTATGISVVNVASNATKVIFWTLSGTSVNIEIKLTGNPISSTTSGVAYQFTSTTTSNTAGTYYFTIVGAGGGGGAGVPSGFNPGGGGSTGTLTNVGPVVVTSSFTATIGAAGSGGSGSEGANGTAGGSTSVAISGGSTYDSNGGAAGLGGNEIRTDGAGPSAAMSPTFVGSGVILGTTGGGGRGVGFQAARPGTGSGIGTGGNGGSANGNLNGDAGTGKGSGGGGGGSGNATYGDGGNGTAGVVYAFKIF